MNGVNFSFDASQVEPNRRASALPEAWYTCAIDRSEMKPNSKRTGHYLEFGFTVLDGEHVGRKFTDRLNVDNPNATTVEIAYGTLSAICHATGVIQLQQNTTELHGRPMRVFLKLRQPEVGADGKQYDASNEVGEYASLNGGGAAPAMPWANQQQQPAPPAAQHAAQQAPPPPFQAPQPPQFQPQAPQAPAQPWQPPQGQQAPQPPAQGQPWQPPQQGAPQPPQGAPQGQPWAQPQQQPAPPQAPQPGAQPWAQQGAPQQGAPAGAPAAPWARS